MLLGLFGFSLHLDDFVFKLLVFKHEKFVLGVKLGDAVQGAIDLDSQRHRSLVDSLVVRRRLLRPRFRTRPSPIACLSLLLSLLWAVLMVCLSRRWLTVTIDAGKFSFVHIADCAAQKLGQVLRHVLDSLQVTQLILQLKDLVKLYLLHFADFCGNLKVGHLIFAIGRVSENVI